MNEKKQCRYKFRWTKFSKRFIFWALNIPINMLPIFLRYFRDVSIDTFGGIKQLLFQTASDFDFSFICIGVVFVLCIEGLFADEEPAKIYNKFLYGVFLYNTVLIILYVCFLFKPEFFSGLGKDWAFKYNITLIGLTLILGLLCNAIISLEKRCTN